MNSQVKFRLLFVWCFLLSLWGGYIAYKFIEHERWAYKVNTRMLENQKEIKRLLLESEK
jgi:hypothetical protein